MDWGKVAYFCLLSRFMDLKERSERLPMSFPAMGHELVQVLTALLMEHEKDSASVYYRSRPLALALGIKPEDIFYANMGKGRDVGMMYYLRGKILPTVGDVGGQFPKAVGWAQAIRYKGWDGAVAVAMGGDGSIASSGFWSALNISTTLNLPMVFVIEDNGWGIGVPSYLQTPGGNIAENLRSFKNLTVLEGRGYIPEETYRVLKEGFKIARKNRTVLIRFEVARIEGHSISDRQEYRSREEIEKSREKDPIVYLRSLVENWEEVESRAKADVERAWEEAKKREGERGNLKKYIFFEGEFAQGDKVRKFNMNKHPKMKMALAIRKAMEEALEENEDVLIFGEDVGLKGGIYGITRGFVERFGERRVFDTSLNELGIVGRAEGMAYAGLKPIAEIQFRKYADEARQAIHNIGFVRWRTNNAFSAPIILRIPVGFLRGISDPWHSFSAEQEFLHMFGWKIAYPSNAEDAYYLLKEALSMNDPVIFLEHRELYFSKLAEKEISEFLPFGKGRVVKSGNSLTIVSWGYTLYEALEGVKDMDVEVIDLRTLKPWDEELVFESAKKTGRLLVVHEDSLTCGFGAEIVSRVVEETFESLKIAPRRLAVPDVPIPFSQELFNLAYPTADKIRKVVEEMLSPKT
jgi:2-oxoisovalerate dehydrogenase E1 component